MISKSLAKWAPAHRAGAHFANDLPLAVQGGALFRFAVIQILIKRSLQTFAHDTTARQAARLVRHLALWRPKIVLMRNELFIDVELRVEIINKMG